MSRVIGLREDIQLAIMLRELINQRLVTSGKNQVNEKSNALKKTNK